MAANNNAVATMEVSKAMKLLEIARNSPGISPNLNVFAWHDGDMRSEFEFEASALKSNTTIEFLSLQILPEICEPSEKWVEDICNFLTHNPSLTTVAIAYADDYEGFLNKIYQTMAKNKSIQRVLIRDDTNDPEPLPTDLLLRNLGDFTALTYLDITPTENMADLWPSVHSIKYLVLRGAKYGREETAWAVEWLEKLANCRGSSVISHLYLGMEWHANIAAFLSSPWSAIENFHIDAGEDFTNSTISQLLGGLMASPTTKTLCLGSGFNGETLQTIRGRLDSPLFPVKTLDLRVLSSSHLDYISQEANEFFVCENLEHLGILNHEWGHYGISIFEPTALARSRISSLGLSGPLARVIPALRAALTTGIVTKLQINNYDLRGETTVNDLIELIMDEDCNLELLELGKCRWDDRMVALIPRIFSALEDKVSLKSLRIQTSPTTFQVLINSLELRVMNWKSLEHLAVVHVAEETVDNLIDFQLSLDLKSAILQNWSLETLSFSQQREYAYWKAGEMLILHQQDRQFIEGVMNRNMFKKLIFAAPPSDTGSVAHWCHKIEQFWGLADEMSLIFWLLEQEPQFFLQPVLAGDQGTRRMSLE